MKKMKTNGKRCLKLLTCGFRYIVSLRAPPPDGLLRLLRLLRPLTPSGILAILCGSGDHSEHGGSPLPYGITTLCENSRHAHAEAKRLLKIQNLRVCVRVATFVQ